MLSSSLRRIRNVTAGTRVMLIAGVLLAVGYAVFSVAGGFRHSRKEFRGQLNAAVVDASLSDPPAELQKLLELGADPNAIYRNRTPLGSAVSFVTTHNLEKVRILLDGGADPNISSEDSTSQRS